MSAEAEGYRIERSLVDWGGRRNPSVSSSRFLIAKGDFRPATSKTPGSTSATPVYEVVPYLWAKVAVVQWCTTSYEVLRSAYEYIHWEVDTRMAFFETNSAGPKPCTHAVHPTPMAPCAPLEVSL